MTALVLLLALAGVADAAESKTYKDGVKLYDAGDHSGAIIAWQKGMVAARARGDHAETYALAQIAASALSERGDAIFAAPLFDIAAGAAEGMKNPTKAAQMLLEAGDEYRAASKLAKARDRYGKAMAVGVRLEDKGLRAFAHLTLGRVDLAEGDTRQALRHAGVALARFDELKSDRFKARALELIAQAYQAMGNSSVAAGAAEHALRFAEQAEEPETAVDSLVTLAAARARLGHIDEAQKGILRAHTLAKDHGYRAGLARVELVDGLILAQIGKTEDAAKLLVRAAARAQARDDLIMLARALAELGTLEAAQGQADLALKHLSQALGHLTEAEAPGDWARERLAVLHLDAGRRAEAVATAGKIAAPAPWLQGRLALAAGDAPQAARHYEACLRAAGDATERFACLCGLGHSRSAAGQWGKARDAYLQAVAATEEERESLPAADREHFFSAKIKGLTRAEPYEGLARAYAELGDEDEAFLWSESLKARFLAETLAESAQRVARADEGRALFSLVPYEALSEERIVNIYVESAARSLRWGDRPNFVVAYTDTEAMGESMLRVTKLMRDTDAEKSDAELEERVQQSLDYESSKEGKGGSFRERYRKEMDQAKERKAAFISKVRKKYPQYAAVKFPQPLGRKSVELAADEVLVEFKVADSGSLLFVLRGKGRKLSVRQIPAGRERLRQAVDGIRRSFEGVEKAADLARFDPKAAKALHDLLFGSALEGLAPGTRLIIVPDDTLGLLPFEALVAKLEPGAKLGEGPHGPFPLGAAYLGDLFSVSYAQSATSLTLMRLQPPSSAKPDLVLAVADPDFSGAGEQGKEVAQWRTMGAAGTRARGVGSAVKDDGLFPRLARTHEVAVKTRALFGDKAVVLERGAATKKAVLAAPWEKVRHVVFGTHGLIADSVPLLHEPALVLANPGRGGEGDGFLAMSEILGLTLHAETVALTACETGVGKSLAGEGVLGMGRAFQLAGAKDVLMSLWQVSEDGAVALTNEFLSGLSAGKSARDSLTEARRVVRREGYEHPFYWSAFILMSR